MELFATGFNAWNQLRFGDPTYTSCNPEDLESFESVLRTTDIQKVHASLSRTIVTTSAKTHLAGFPDEWERDTRLQNKILEQTAAIAGNGLVAIYDEETRTFRQFNSLILFRNETHPDKIFSNVQDVIQVVAYETGFAALTRKGEVWSWGDERYAACLGREISESNPADRPCLVEDLNDLPTGRIKKLAAGGYHVMGTTEGKDLYAWGGHPGRPALIEGLSGSPEPVVIDESDVLDCAVGESHAILLTEDRVVYVIGDNGNGQLGIKDVHKASTWTRLTGHRSGDSSPSAVFAGPRCSFIVYNSP